MNFSLCSICNMSYGEQIVPDRSIPEINLNATSWWSDIMCVLCFDNFLGDYHHIFYKIKNRELTGKLK